MKGTVFSALYAVQKIISYNYYFIFKVLPQTLLKNIQSQGAEIELNSACSQIEFNKQGALLTFGDKKILAKNVISTIPAQR